MSWGKIDDGYWEHGKTEALIELPGLVGLAAAGAYWILHSYCDRNHRGRFTIWEASMVLRRPPDEVRAILAPLFVEAPGFERGFLLGKQSDSCFEFNSWDCFKPKSEAKARAGRLGGVKSGESRRSKKEAEPEKREAPDPDPDPDVPIQIPIPIIAPEIQPPLRQASVPISGRAPTPSAWSAGKPIETTSDFERAVESWRWMLGANMSPKERGRLHRVLAAGAIEPHEAEHARLTVEENRDPVARPVSFFLGCVEQGRRRYAEESSRDSPAGAEAAKRAKSEERQRLRDQADAEVARLLAQHPEGDT